ncbi:tetratricopeptide repeat protein [Bradyrhizobium yuanmingense]|uniref:tetratricopeptide repeat protein n=1 Tax=Bradyrhizobium yuanmingense TaxID=108015 RepID=UPI0023B91557|nr:tetratricopeptide repeat protein [Bradyrhizobium yuanmingense]MDF0582215.1 tetratricopeptide repeat protein [Bradyrhizobium yuanmingense]
MRSGFSARLWLVALALAAAVVSRPAAADDRQACLDGSKAASAENIAACTRAIQSGDYNNQDLAGLYHARGYSWSATSFADRDDRALADFTAAIRANPKSSGSLLNRAHIYNQRHDYDRAIADVNQAFEAGLSDYGKRVGYGERGHAYHGKGDNDRAIADFTASIQLNANDSFAIMARGSAYFAKGDYDRAIADYTQVIALDPEFARDYSARSGRAIAYLFKGNFRRAFADVDQGQALSWFAAGAFLTALVWLCCRRGAHAFGWRSGRTLIEMCEQQLADLRHTNAALEKIAAAVEKRSSR